MPRLQDLPDLELNQVGETAYAAMQLNPADYPGLTDPMVADAKARNATFGSAISNQDSLDAQARAAVQLKREARAPVPVDLRHLYDLTKLSGATEAALTALGIPSSPSQAAPPVATVPVASVDTSKRLAHTISWFDESTPGNKRRPRGAIGAEIWSKIGGDPPADPKECGFVTLDTATPYFVEYDGADAGKMVHYMLRWLNTDGSKGNWSETVSATITG